MTTHHTHHSLSRRAVVTGLGVGGLGLALGGRFDRAAAQQAAPTTQATPPSAEGQTATINGANLYYEILGPDDGHPVLLLHGSLGNTEEFANVVPALVEGGYRTVAFDARGRGRSTWGDAPITYAQMAADALGVLELLGIGRTNVVGWSQGGMVALELAIRHHERLNRVVAYGANFSPDGNYTDIHPTDQVPPFEKFIADYQRLSPEPDRWDELLGVLGALDATAPNFSAEELGRIAVPVLILDGAMEEFIKPEHTRRLAELIPGAELVLMPDTGHFAPFAKPEEFNRIVLAFLKGEAIGTPTT